MSNNVSFDLQINRINTFPTPANGTIWVPIPEPSINGYIHLSEFENRLNSPPNRRKVQAHLGRKRRHKHRARPKYLWHCPDHGCYEKAGSLQGHLSEKHQIDDDRSKLLLALGLVGCYQIRRTGASRVPIASASPMPAQPGIEDVTASPTTVSTATAYLSHNVPNDFSHIDEIVKETGTIFDPTLEFVPGVYGNVGPQQTQQFLHDIAARISGEAWDPSLSIDNTKMTDVSRQNLHQPIPGLAQYEHNQVSWFTAQRQPSDSTLLSTGGTSWYGPGPSAPSGPSQTTGDYADHESFNDTATLNDFDENFDDPARV